MRAVHDFVSVVMPTPKDFSNDHTHFRFELVCEPAGTNKKQESKTPLRDITLTNQTLICRAGCRLTTRFSGILIANFHDGHSSGKGPYSVTTFSQHRDLAAAWPPIPLR
jgi:hypothetical protein